MHDNKTDRRFWEYNSIIKENDELYRHAAKASGLSECAFWILYALRADGEKLTQSDICNSLYQPKQTVNSALKKLENEGYIALLHAGDQRGKPIHLTEKGLLLAARTVDRVIGFEHAALRGLSDEEQETFIRLFRQYTGLLKDKLLAADAFEAERG